MIEAILVSEPDSNGNAVYRVHKDGIGIGAIVFVQGANGWRYNNWVPGRRGSRTISETPQLAAQKYFGKLVKFTKPGAL